MSVSVTNIYVNQFAYGTSYTETFTGSASVGDTVAFVLNVDNSTTQTLAITDSAGNSYTQRSQESVTSGNLSLFMCDCTLTHAIVGGTTTFSFTPTADSSWNCLAYDIKGGAASSPQDQLAGNQNGSGGNTGATITSASVTPGQEPVIALAAFVCNSTWVSYGSIAGNAATGLNNTAAADSRIIITEWLEISTASSVDATCTIGATFREVATCFWTYKEAGAGAATTPIGLMMMGMGM